MYSQCAVWLPFLVHPIKLDIAETSHCQNHFRCHGSLGNHPYRIRFRQDFLTTYGLSISAGSVGGTYHACKYVDLVDVVHSTVSIGVLVWQYYLLEANGG